MDPTEPSWNIFNDGDNFISTSCAFKRSLLACSALAAPQANLLAEGVSSSSELHLLQRSPHEQAERNQRQHICLGKGVCPPPWHAFLISFKRARIFSQRTFKKVQAPQLALLGPTLLSLLLGLLWGPLHVGIGGVMRGLRPPDGGAFAVQRPLDTG